MKKMLLCLLLIAGSLNAVAQSKKMAASQDMKFAMEAAMGGILEVQLGRLAQTNGSAQQVKDLGRMMVEDHSRANQELLELAKRKNWRLPAILSPAMQAQVERFSKLRGAEFDRAYVREMETDHRKDIKEFQMEAGSGTDADLKTWANGKVPVLQMHLDHVLSTAGAIGMGNGQGNHSGHDMKK